MSDVDQIEWDYTRGTLPDSQQKKLGLRAT